MSLISLRCPSCGAEIVFSGESVGHCPYCDSQLHFDDLVDKAELERLRFEHSRYERQKNSRADYQKRLKSWKTAAFAVGGAMAALNIAGFQLTLFKSGNVGVPLVLMALLILILAPAVLGAVRPVMPAENGQVSGGGAKRAIGVFALYGIGLSVMVISIIAAAVIAVAMGYETRSERSSRIAAEKHSDECDIFVSEWTETICSSDDDAVEQYYACQIPDEVWERDKESKDTYILLERQRALVDQALEQYKLKVRDVEKLKELTDDELLGAEEYFRTAYDCDVTVMQGYEYHYIINVKSPEGDSTREGDNDMFACAVKLKGEGWKIIPENSSELR